MRPERPARCALAEQQQWAAPLLLSIAGNMLAGAPNARHACPSAWQRRRPTHQEGGVVQGSRKVLLGVQLGGGESSLRADVVCNQGHQLQGSRRCVQCRCGQQASHAELCRTTARANWWGTGCLLGSARGSSAHGPSSQSSLSKAKASHAASSPGLQTGGPPPSLLLPMHGPPTRCFSCGPSASAASMM